MTFLGMAVSEAAYALADAEGNAVERTNRKTAIAALFFFKFLVFTGLPSPEKFFISKYFYKPGGKSSIVISKTVLTKYV
jgi:hypothetical protein